MNQCATKRYRTCKSSKTTREHTNLSAVGPCLTPDKGRTLATLYGTVHGWSGGKRNVTSDFPHLANLQADALNSSSAKRTGVARFRSARLVSSDQLDCLVLCVRQDRIDVV